MYCKLSFTKSRITGNGVLIVAKCIVNKHMSSISLKFSNVLIVAKCIVNLDGVNGNQYNLISINSSKVYCKYLKGGENNE